MRADRLLATPGRLTGLVVITLNPDSDDRRARAAAELRRAPAAPRSGGSPVWRLPGLAAPRFGGAAPSCYHLCMAVRICAMCGAGLPDARQPPASHAAVCLGPRLNVGEVC